MEMTSTIRLLLVDDETEFRQAAHKALERRGYEITEAASGAEALECLRARRPDVVLLDLRMAGMDGISTLEEIRAREPELPVIILTGHGELGDALSGIGLDIVDFIHKPVDLDLLAEHVRRLLAIKDGQPLRERSVAELMVPLSSYAQVHEDETLAAAVVTLREAFFRPVADRSAEVGHRSVAVFDRQERFVGMLHVHDVVGAVVPAYLASSPYPAAYTGLFLAHSKMLGRLTVGDLVEEETPIEVDTPLMGAAELMARRRTVNLPVGADGEVVGVLRDKDLFNELADALRLSPTVNRDR